jgi:hypothetical protein
VLLVIEQILRWTARRVVVRQIKRAALISMLGLVLTFGDIENTDGVHGLHVGWGLFQRLSTSLYYLQVAMEKASGR